MPAGLIALHALLVVLGFLVTTNYYLRGAAKAQIAAGISVLMILTLGAIWFLFGWKAGAIAIPLAYVYVGVTVPLAKRTAWKLLGYRTSAESGAEFNDLHALQAGRMELDEYFRKAESRREREDAELKRVLAKPSVQRSLHGVGGSEEEVVELVRVLSLTGAGRELSLAAITDQNLLPELVQMRREGKTPIELAAKVMKM